MGKEIIQRKDIIHRTKEMLVGEKDGNGRLSFWNTVTAGILPIVFMIVCLYYLLNTIVTKRRNQIEHVVNLLILTIISLALFCLMVGLSSMVPQLSNETETWNNVVNIAMNIILYFIICALVTVLSKVTVSPPSTEESTVNIE